MTKIRVDAFWGCDGSLVLVEEVHDVAGGGDALLLLTSA
jgi:hypothetical protein